MPRTGMSSIFRQTSAGMQWKVSLEAIEVTKRAHANLAGQLLLTELSEILAPFKFRRGRQFKIDWSMGSLTLEVWDEGEMRGFWFWEGDTNKGSKVTAILWARPSPLHIALKKILDILGALDNDEDDIILYALDGKFIEVNHL